MDYQVSERVAAQIERNRASAYEAGLNGEDAPTTDVPALVDAYLAGAEDRRLRIERERAEEQVAE
jgi:hypothetical protein